MFRPVPRRRRGRPRAVAVLTTAALAAAGLAGGLLPGAPPAHADPAGYCAPASGAVVAVDSGHGYGPAPRDCDAQPASGPATTGPGSTQPTTPAATDTPTSAATGTPTSTGTGAPATSAAPSASAASSDPASTAPRPAGPNADPATGTATGTPTGTPTAPATEAAGGADGTLPRDPDDQKAAAAGAGYLVKQLAGGDHLSNAYGPDYGLSADLALALASTGGQDAALTKVTGYLAGHVAEYADPAGTSQYPGPYSGATAKLAVLAEVMGQDPHAFGGFDLLATLTGHVCTAAKDDGSCTAEGDFSQAYSTVSQALGVLALARGGVTPPPAAVARLLQLQCSDGGFSSTLIAPGADCTSDVDTTGYALQALTLAPGHAGQVAAARAYLVKSQQKNGGYQGAAGVSSNSTALAVQALLAADKGSSQEARDGQAFLRATQNGDGGFRITDAAGDSDVRSSTQAVNALAGTPLTTLTHALGPITPVGGTSGGSGGASSGGSSGGAGGSGGPSNGAGTPGGSSSETSSSTSSGSSAGTSSGSTSGGPGPDGSLAATGTNALAAACLALLLAASGAVMVAARRRVARGGGGGHR